MGRAHRGTEARESREEIIVKKERGWLLLGFKPGTKADVPIGTEECREVKFALIR